MDINNFIFENIMPLAVGLYVLGFLILKPTKLIKDKFIPLILCLLGVVGAFGILTIQNKAEFTTAVIQGILATGVAVLAHQTPKQLIKKE